MSCDCALTLDGFTDQRRRPLALIADDDPDTRLLMEHCVKRDHFDVVTAADGDEALERALLCLPDVMLLDLRMPGKSGLEVLHALRSASDTQDMPIVVVSAAIGSLDNARRAGADLFMPKPFEPKLLSKYVRAGFRTRPLPKI